jgi:hypothetical protein
LKKLKSIQPIAKRYATYGSSPILILGSDLNYWVCKYKDVNKLFNELLAYHFACLWHINIPESALIEIDYEKHVLPFEDRQGLVRLFFERECFGSSFLEKAFDIHQFILTNADVTRKIKNKEDFLKIALFDIWLSNEDRNQGNYNLLLQSVKGGYMLLYIIDNTDIFNSSMAYGNTITELTQEDSLLNSALATLLFGEDSRLSQKVDLLLKDFYLFVEECQRNLPSILDAIPQKWKIDIANYHTKINMIFSPRWLDICEHTFREYVQTFIISK